jgi:hypothetical protein
VEEEKQGMVVDNGVEGNKRFPHMSTDIEVCHVGRLVVVIDVNPSHGFWTTRLMKLFGHEGK